MDKVIVDKINNSGKKFYLALTGGGTGFVGEYVAFGGASKALIGVNIPYNQRAFDKFIRGNKIDTYASEEGARKLAVASFKECIEAGVSPKDAIGVGASCSVASTSPEREGRKHKIHIAFHTHQFTIAHNYILNQGRTRAEEEKFINYLIYNELAWLACDEKVKPYTLEFQHDEVRRRHYAYSGDDVIRLYNGDESKDIIQNHPKIDDDTIVIYSGSWNPLHDGHREIIKRSEDILRRPVILEYSINNTDKGLVDFIDINNRTNQMSPYLSVITRASYFRDKVKLFKKYYPDKKIVFVVGYDTWERIWDESYCEDKNPALEERIFSQNRVQFLVFGRGEKFKPLEYFWGECLRIKDPRAENFTMDISSSALRAALNKV